MKVVRKTCEKENLVEYSLPLKTTPKNSLENFQKQLPFNVTIKIIFQKKKRSFIFNYITYLPQVPISCEINIASNMYLRTFTRIGEA